jgi:hypothetical protein
MATEVAFASLNVIRFQFEDMLMDFKNLGFFSSIFQRVANTASNTVRLKPESVVCDKS